MLYYGSEREGEECEGSIKEKVLLSLKPATRCTYSLDKGINIVWSTVTVDF